MKWELSFRLQPGENVLETQDEQKKFGLKTMHGMVLTDRRVLFKYNSLNTGLVQSFSLDEVEEICVMNRLLIKYLRIIAAGKEYFYNIEKPEDIGWRISEIKHERTGRPADAANPEKAQKHSLAELLVMLETLKEYGLLTQEEYDQKRKLIS